MTADFAAIVSTARRRADMTAAEFDYSLFAQDGKALAALQDAVYALANRGHDPVDDETQNRQARAEALRTEVQAQIDAMIDAAKAKRYTGWSDASGGPVRYAY